MIYISNPQNTRYYGIYFDNGTWKQGGYEALAILSEIPSAAGNYEGQIITKETYADAKSVFDVTFKPSESGVFVQDLTTANNKAKMNGKAYAPYTPKYKKIGWYK